MERHTPHSLLNAAVAFFVTALIASILLVAALLLVLGDLLGSHLLSLVIVGGVCGVISWIIYLLALRPVIRSFERQISTIYEVAHAARQAYDWALKTIVERLF